MQKQKKLELEIIMLNKLKLSEKNIACFLSYVTPNLKHACKCVCVLMHLEMEMEGDVRA